MKFQAILFDLDGTLVDTIDLYAEACIHALSTSDLSFTHDDFNRLYGTGAIFREWILEIGGTDEMLPVFREKRDLKHIELLGTRTTFLPGAERLLARVSSYPKAIVTGSWKKYVDAIELMTPISPHFPHILTADDTDPFHKPHPHGLLLAADRLGVAPEECIYIGDQIFDIKAANAAGMTSCLIPGKFTSKEGREAADHIIEALDGLMGLIE